ncbi:MAG: METTL5 family protein, partial [Candidatus Bathyarchaeia archaeon]
PNPQPKLEQYTIPADVAATMLYLASNVYNDLEGKRVLDLGCGTGRLALGAAFLGAKQIVGLDLDKAAIRTAVENSKLVGLSGKVEWIVGDVDAVDDCFDTVLQNPPFGVQTRGADRKFLKKALAVGRRVYSIHKSPRKNGISVKKLKNVSEGIVPIDASPFLKNFVETHRGKIVAVYATVMSLPHMFGFHTKSKHEFIVDLYVLEQKH